MAKVDDETSAAQTITTFVKDWKEVIGTVAVALTTIAGAWLGEERVRPYCWGASVVVVALGALIIARARRRKQEQAARKQKWEEHQDQRTANSAFRSLAPFERKDKLPGSERQREARVIATRVASDDFRYGVVCGDAGCGKTSLLQSELCQILEASHLKVEYVRSQRRLEDMVKTQASAREQLPLELQALESNYVKPGIGVLILDQFEEWFIDYRGDKQRKAIGALLRQIIERDPPVRVLVAVRREFLIDLHDMEVDHSDPLKGATYFHLRNFSVDQAIDVISECAEADGLVPDATFAKTVATDLAEDEEVRPPALQIVCTYLATSGALDTARYHAEGGTAGILADYIQKGLSSCINPDSGARLLRALCDFPAHAKRKPQSLEELVARSNSAGARATKKLKAEINDIAEHFVRGRLMAKEPRRDGSFAYSLMHDYLVDAVDLATATVSSQTEKANQLLQYYVGERLPIPFRRLLFIRRFADRGHLQQQRARNILRRSAMAPLLASGTVIVAGLIFAAVMYLWLTVGISWRAALVGQYKEGDDATFTYPRAVPHCNRVVTSDTKVVRLWDARTAAALESFDCAHNHASLADSSPLLVLQNNWPRSSGDQHGARIIDLANGASQSFSRGSEFRISSNGRFLIWDDTKPSDSGGPEQLFVAIRPTTDAGETWTLKMPPGARTLDADVPSAGDRLIIQLIWQDPSKESGYYLYDAKHGNQLASLGKYGLYSINDASRLVLKVENRGLIQDGEGAFGLRVTSLDDGHLMSKCDFNRSDFIQSHISSSNGWLEAWFTPDGSRIVAVYTEGEELAKALVLRTSDLKPASEIGPRTASCPSHDTFRSGGYQPFYLHNWKPPLLYWNDVSDLKVWDPTNDRQCTLRGVNIGVSDKATFSHSRAFALVQHKSAGRLQLWDLQSGTSRAELTHKARLVGAKFSPDDTVILTLDEPGVLSVYDAEDGDEIPIKLFFVTQSPLVHYERAVHRLHVWDEQGRVTSYTEGRYYFGRFVPTVSQPMTP